MDSTKRLVHNYVMGMGVWDSRNNELEFVLEVNSIHKVSRVNDNSIWSIGHSKFARTRHSVHSGFFWSLPLVRVAIRSRTQHQTSLDMIYRSPSQSLEDGQRWYEGDHLKLPQTVVLQLEFSRNAQRSESLDNLNWFLLLRISFRRPALFWGASLQDLAEPSNRQCLLYSISLSNSRRKKNIYSQEHSIIFSTADLKTTKCENKHWIHFSNLMDTLKSIIDCPVEKVYFQTSMFT